MKLLIQNGWLINPRARGGRLDILVSDGKIAGIAPHIMQEDAQCIDATGYWVTPGLIDMHVHLREPGFEYKEDIASGTDAAVHGGFTAVACMPNTDPVNDNESVLCYIKSKAAQAGRARVYPICAITKGLQGKELTEMGILLLAGAVAFSDDGKPVSDANRMRLALEYAKNFDALIISHCEEISLSQGVMNEGYYSAILGLDGITRAAEEVMVARDILLAQAIGTKVHIAHVSTAGSVKLIREAKARGVKVTCETAPHYFSATDEWVCAYDTNTKMNPPLRTDDDVAAIKQGLRDGTIDVIATDHAPHHIDEKRVEYNMAQNGIVGLETAFSLAMTHLVKEGVLTDEQLIERMSVRPAQLLKVEGGVLQEGAPADIAIFDPHKEVVYTEKNLHSKSKNTPFLGRRYIGAVVQTIVGGVPML